MTDQTFASDAPLTTARDQDVAEQAVGRDDESAIIGRTVTINRPRQEIYDFWRDFRNLAAVMENVESIETVDARRSHWRVKAPAGRTVEWDAVVTEDEPGRLIAWQSVEGADVSSSGRVEFLDAAPGRGTMVRATIAYDAPAGGLGEWIAKLLSARTERPGAARLEAP